LDKSASREVKKIKTSNKVSLMPKTVVKLIKNFPLLTLAIPGILYFLIFHYIPMFGAIIAFKEYNYEQGILGSEWVGFENFKFFFQSQDAMRITVNTVGYGFVFIIVGVISAVTVALLLFEVKNKGAIKYYQTTMILPNFLSWVIVGYITYTLFNQNLGIFNQILRGIGLQEVNWYSDPKVWPVILTLTNIWKLVGMNCIMYYASLMAIDEQIFEAATIDGASRIKQIWHISIPSLIPLIAILSILNLGNIFRGDFGLFYQIPRDVGLLYPTTDVIDTYIYRGLKNGDIGISSAVGLFQSVVGFATIIVANTIVKKVNPDYSLY
jgi:putative aldouronate transport system permease protein